jgi:hypothetical protein
MAIQLLDLQHIEKLSACKIALTLGVNSPQKFTRPIFAIQSSISASEYRTAFVSSRTLSLASLP